MPVGKLVLSVYLQTYASHCSAPNRTVRTFCFTERGRAASLMYGTKRCRHTKTNLFFHFRTASKHVDKDLGNIEENKKLEENNHKSET